ncbi:MAG: hypothetical protein ACT6RN_27600 [Agrobacterium sp.]|uniref:hypothetical protein n=1 Tax=Agrobacterium sp. TaxID=361 RepID=UPI004037C08F
MMGVSENTINSPVVGSTSGISLSTEQITSLLQQLLALQSNQSIPNTASTPAAPVLLPSGSNSGSANVTGSSPKLY